MLLELKQQGLTSIIITHKLNEAAYVSDRITVLRDGATVAQVRLNSFAIVHTQPKKRS